MGDSPVGRFSPAPGITVDRTANRTMITGSMQLYGPAASGARAQSIAHSINTLWTASFPSGYAIHCRVSVRYRSERATPANVVQIEAVSMAGPSHVNTLTMDMTLNAREPDAFTWTAAHEFGHILGLQDRYSESLMSSIVGMFGGTRTNTVDPRYQANLMAVTGGVLEAQNLRDLTSENLPNWLNDDDRVLDWVMHHGSGDITALSAPQKVAMIRTLASGWVAAEDLVGIERICQSVRSQADARAIRASLDPVDFSDLGQRTRLRVAFANMP